MIQHYGLSDRVRLIGLISQEELLAFYANCLAVFFGPFEEDYGYITLEAMLSAKPVITCNDSGGPLEFITHESGGPWNSLLTNQKVWSWNLIQN